MLCLSCLVDVKLAKAQTYKKVCSHLYMYYVILVTTGQYKT